MKGITYAQLAAAADAMVAEGKVLSLRTLRERLGSGSLATVHKHYATWLDSNQKPSAAALTISQSLTSAMLAEIARSTAEARAGLEAKLTEAQAAAVDLANAGELLEAERDDLVQKVSELTRERDNVAGRSAQQAIDLAGLAGRIEKEQATLGRAQIELALERVKLVDLRKRVSDQESEIERKSAALEHESAARVVADQSAAVFRAQNQNLVEQGAKAEARIDSLSKQLGELGSELQSVRLQAHSQQAEGAAVNRDLQEALSQAQRATAEMLMQAQRASEEALFQAQRATSKALMQAQRATEEAQEATAAAKRADMDTAELKGRLAGMQESARSTDAGGQPHG